MPLYRNADIARAVVKTDRRRGGVVPGLGERARAPVSRLLVNTRAALQVVDIHMADVDDADSSMSCGSRSPPCVISSMASSLDQPWKTILYMATMRPVRSEPCLTVDEDGVVRLVGHKPQEVQHVAVLRVPGFEGYVDDPESGAVDKLVVGVCYPERGDGLDSHRLELFHPFRGRLRAAKERVADFVEVGEAGLVDGSGPLVFVDGGRGGAVDGRAGAPEARGAQVMKKARAVSSSPTCEDDS